MAELKISQMDAAQPLTGAELVPLVQDGINVAATASALRGTAATLPGFDDEAQRVVDASLVAHALAVDPHPQYTTAAELAAATDLLQEELVSGTNIKTVNGVTLLGSGNLVVSGGGGAGAREQLSADTVIYVRKAGSDLEDGTSPATAFLTIGRAIAKIARSLDLAGFTVTIDVGAGTWTENVIIRDTPRGVVKLSGPTSAILNPSGSATIILVERSRVEILGFTIGGAGTAYAAVQAGNGSSVKLLGGTVFKATYLFAAFAIAGALLTVAGNYSVDGTGVAGSTSILHMGAYDGASVAFVTHTCTFVGSPHFSFFIQAGRCGSVTAGDAIATYSGGIRTGCKKYDAYTGGAIWAAANVFPGSVAGTIASGGAYA